MSVGTKANAPSPETRRLGRAEALWVPGTHDLVFVGITGWLSQAAEFRPLVKRLGAHGYETAVVNLLAPDDSTGPVFPTRIGQLSHVLSEFPDRRIVLVGHSMGSVIAAGYRCQYVDQRVKALALMAPPLEPSRFARRSLRAAQLMVMLPPRYTERWRASLARSWSRRALAGAPGWVPYTPDDVIPQARQVLRLTAEAPTVFAPRTLPGRVEWMLHRDDRLFPPSSVLGRRDLYGPDRTVECIPAQHMPSARALIRATEPLLRLAGEVESWPA